MRLALTALALCALMGPTHADAQERPTAVMARVGELDAQCRAAGGRPGNATYIFVHDYTGDGIVDYLFSEGMYQCHGRPNVLRDNGESFTEIYVVDRAGAATRVYRERLIASRILDQRPRVVQIAQRGAACGAGAAPNTQCGATLRWDQRTGRFDAVPTGANASAQTSPGPSDPAVTAALPLADIAINATAQPAPNGLTPQRAFARLAPARYEEMEYYGAWNNFYVLVGAHSGGGMSPHTPVTAVQFELSEMRLQHSPYDVVGALRARGASVAPVACAGEWTIYQVTPQGRAPFTSLIRIAPAGGRNPMFVYNFTFWLNGRVVTQENASALVNHPWRACAGAR